MRKGGEDINKTEKNKKKDKSSYCSQSSPHCFFLRMMVECASSIK